MHSHDLSIVPGRPAASPARPRLVAMSALRVAAALWLVGYHLALTHVLDPVPLPASLRTALANGSAVTGLFIMLSGFMMCFAYTDAEGRLRTSAREIWIGRVARLWPVMMLGHLMALPFAVVGTERYGAAEALGRGVLTTTGLQGWVPGWAFSFNGPAWTLSVLAFCYVMLPRVVRALAGRSTGQLVAILIATWAAMLLPTSLHFAALPTGFGIASDAPESVVEMVLHAFPPLRFPEFVAGAVLARLFARRPSRESGALAAIGALAGVAVFAFLARERTLAERFVANGLLSPLYWMLILGVASAPRWVEQAASRLKLDVLGEASLSMFILHMPPVLVLQYMRRHGMIADSVLAALVPAFMLSMLAVSWMLEMRFVRPVATWMKAWLGARLVPAAATPAQVRARVASVTPISSAIRRSGEPPTGSRPGPRSTAA